MRKIISLLSLLFLVFTSFPQTALAAGQCKGVQAGINTTKYITDGTTQTHVIKIDMSNSSYNKDLSYRLNSAYSQLAGGNVRSPQFTLGSNGTFSPPATQLPTMPKVVGTIVVQGNVVTWTIDDQTYLASKSRTHTVSLLKSLSTGVGDATLRECDLGTFKTSTNTVQQTCKLFVWQERNGNECYASHTVDSCTEKQVKTFARVEGLTNDDGTPYKDEVRFEWRKSSWLVNLFGYENVTANNGVAESSSTLGEEGEWFVEVAQKTSGGDTNIIEGCRATFDVSVECKNLCDETPSDMAGVGSEVPFVLCEQATPEGKVECEKCVEDGNHMWTAIGCIPTEPQGIIQTIIKLGLGLGGGVTLILILAGAFRLSVSQGDPKQAEEAKEQITSAVIGLLFILFSITMLRFIGVQVLQIPGFGG